MLSGTTLALYLSLYKSVEGDGANVPFPRSHKFWVNKYNEPPQDMIAYFPSMRHFIGKWRIICDYFGVKGTGPEDASQPGAYVAAHRKEWDELEKKHNLKKGSVDSHITHPGFQYYITTMFDFDR
ncbi:hypothetical protein CC80DRAFT_542037 [Byssothecium circinans]|uniref:PRISE-like Rossmann-fold domain-containing protein n=1 Tax=Byssothecium circinans TaxID=147558 RepID=A0A6A5UDQ9_9PLEO|nr:hypothetical protein CC80DRAFT_542037 [Byssothecium circinans]